MLIYLQLSTFSSKNPSLQNHKKFLWMLSTVKWVKSTKSTQTQIQKVPVKQALLLPLIKDYDLLWMWGNISRSMPSTPDELTRLSRHAPGRNKGRKPLENAEICNKVQTVRMTHQWREKKKKKKKQQEQNIVKL